MSNANPPLSAHPSFRFLVALWFAALLGFGTWVMPAGVFERAVAATGLANVVPAAGPPLGDNARLAISVVAAMLGALLGLLIASRAGRADRTGADEEEDGGAFIDFDDSAQQPAEPARRNRPLHVREELAEEFDAPHVGPDHWSGSDPAEPEGEAEQDHHADADEDADADDVIAGLLAREREDGPDAQNHEDPVSPAYPPAPSDGRAPRSASSGAHGEMDLAELDERLALALAAYRGEEPEPRAVVRGGDGADDPGADLRDALVRLSRHDRIGRE